MNTQQRSQRTWWLHSRVTTWFLLAFLAIGAILLVAEHRIHLLGALPFILLFAAIGLCLLMHLFMHGGYGGHGEQQSDSHHADSPDHAPYPSGRSGQESSSEERTMSTNVSAYGLWPIVIVNAGVFIMFAFSFTHPHTARDWRSFGAFSAFLVALFTEMYGFPLTIYLLSGWLSSVYPGINLYAHNTGHLWETLLGWKGDPHLNPLHLLSYVVIFAGFALIAAAWNVLYKAQRTHSLAMTGVYTRLRHPQYAGFILIMIGFLLQWPTLLTLVMFPILVIMYIRLARREEREVQTTFGEAYTLYAANTPAFFPRLRRVPPAHA